MMFFPYVAWPSCTRAVNLRVVTSLHTCTEPLCERWLLASVLQNVCLVEQQRWLLSPLVPSPGPWH